MKITHIVAIALAASCICAKADFEQDRAAILNMVGEFKVEFYFKETVNLSEGYTLKEKVYNASAHEKVVIVRDIGKEIELQHLLQVQDEVVKHWSQIWKYEDNELLEYQGHRAWKKRTLDAKQAAGTWTQLVTQTTDSPRYESFGIWEHNKGSSSWKSALTARPLPRREYQNRKDYDVIVALNRHTINPEGWVHEQDNAKQVKRDNLNYPLCREVGFNTYTRVDGVDFSAADSYWKENQQFWDAVKKSWRQVLVNKQSYILKKRTEQGSLRFMLGEQEEIQQKNVVKLVSALEAYFSKND